MINFYCSNKNGTQIYQKWDQSGPGWWQGVPTNQQQYVEKQNNTDAKPQHDSKWFYFNVRRFH